MVTRKKILTLIAILHFNLLFCQPIAPAPAHLKYFGYFIVDVEYDDNPDDGITFNNYTQEVASFTNLNQMAAYYPAQNLVARINAMNAQCTKPFLALQEVLYYQIDNNAPSGRHLVLYADYQDRWNQFKSINASVLNPSKIGAFYMVDEPKLNNVSFDDLNNVSQMIKVDYPNIPILLVEAYNQITDLQVPTTVDWLGFDRYTMFNPSTNASYLQNLADLKLKRSTPNQKIFIVSDNNWIPAYGAAGQTAANMDIVAQDYYNLAASDPEIIGLLAWVWPNRVDNEFQIGARSLPQNVKDKNIEIGTRIKANNSPCGGVLALDTNKNIIVSTEPKNIHLSIFPNPAYTNTTLSYRLTQSNNINISLYDLSGKKILELINRKEKSGKHELRLDVSNLTNGVYYIVLRNKDNVQIQKLVIAK
jgi:Secretion system C-terminal sorting domain